MEKDEMQQQQQQQQELLSPAEKERLLLQQTKQVQPQQPQQQQQQQNDPVVTATVVDYAVTGVVVKVPASVAQEAQAEQKETSLSSDDDDDKMSRFWQSLQEKIGTVDESRILFPEYETGEIPRMFSSLEYTTTHHGDDEEGSKNGMKKKKKVVVAARHAAGSVLGAAALVAGTTVGAGVLALPAATAPAGFVPSTVALLVAYVYMTMSGLLIAELTLNRMGRTGRPGVGLLDLYDANLGQPWSMLGSAAYFFLHYAVMTAYVAQGGVNINNLFSTGLPDGVGPLSFAAIVGASIYLAKPSWMEQANNVMVAGVAASFLGIVAMGATTMDWSALVDPANQHPEQVVNCFPILFLSLVFQNVVPTVVNSLEGDRGKIIKAIVAGTTVPLLMFLAWNAVCLGNVMGNPGITDMASIDPVALLQSGQAGGSSALLAPLVTTFSILALVTSMIGFTYGLVNAWTDVLKLPNTSTTNASADYENKWKPALFALTFLPPLVMSLTNPEIFYSALENAGAFGVSTLFIVLPPIMVWKERYHDTDTPLMTRPMVPLGKIPLGSMWKAAATLIVEQGAEKLGFFEWFQEHVMSSMA
jgi:tyrosine-specific transport protein